MQDLKTEVGNLLWILMDDDVSIVSSSVSFSVNAFLSLIITLGSMKVNTSNRKQLPIFIILTD